MRPLHSVALVAVLTITCAGSSPLGPSEPGARPVIARIEPAAAAVGDTVTITGSGFTAADNSLKVGAGYIHKLTSPDQATIRLTLPSYLSACAPGQEVCVALALPLEPGDYKVSVINAHGASNELTLRVVAK
jgi:hypothetical protein